MLFQKPTGLTTLHPPHHRRPFPGQPHPTPAENDLVQREVFLVQGTPSSAFPCDSLHPHHRHAYVSDSSQPHGLQHPRLPSPSVSPWSLLRFMSIESVMLSTISSSAPPFSFAFNLSQHQGLFQLSWLFASGGQSIGVSTSATVLP